MEITENNSDEINKQPDLETTNKPQTGLDDWNDRLDENLEGEKTADPQADEKAKEYSEKYGSGDQTDGE